MEDTPILTVNDLIGAVRLLHERIKTEPQLQKLLCTHPKQEDYDTRIPFKGKDEDFDFLVKILVERQEKDEEIEDLKKELEAERAVHLKTLSELSSTSYSLPLLEEKTRLQSEIHNGINEKLTQKCSELFHESQKSQQEVQILDQEMQNLIQIHDQELLSLKMDHYIENRHLADEMAEIRAENRVLEENRQKMEKWMNAEIESQSVRDWKIRGYQVELEVKELRIKELEDRFTAMESSQVCELEALRAQLARMDVGPDGHRKKRRTSSGSEDSDGWSHVD